MTDHLPVTVHTASHKGVLADVAGVRVRVRNRRTGPPRWLCDAHPDPGGRTPCEHIDELAVTPAPGHLTHPRQDEPTERTPMRYPDPPPTPEADPEALFVAWAGGETPPPPTAAPTPGDVDGMTFHEYLDHLETTTKESNR